VPLLSMTCILWMIPYMALSLSLSIYIYIYMKRECKPQKEPQTLRSHESQSAQTCLSLRSQSSSLSIHLQVKPLAVSTLFRVGIHSFEPVSSNKSSLTQTQKIAFPNNVEDVSDEVKKLNLASVWLLGNPRKMKEREKKNYVNFRVF
jgi:hypothetical protein